MRMQDEELRQAFNKAIHALYSEGFPLMPTEDLKTFGDMLLKLTGELIKTDERDEIMVSVGYCIDNITPHIVSLEDNHRIICFNLLFSELLADIMVFRDNPSREAALYLHSKYMRLIEGKSNHKSYYGFYSWIYGQYAGRKEFRYYKYIPATWIGNVFVLLHEWTHVQDDWRETARKLFLSSELVTDICRKENGELDEAFLDELCCDFMALVMCFNLGVEKSVNVSRKDFLGVVVLSLFVNSLYKFFSNQEKLFVKKADGSVGKEIMEALQTRVKALTYVVKISQNSGLVFQPDEIETALENTRVFAQIMERIGQLLQDGYIEKINEYNAMPEEERDALQSIAPPSLWYISD